MSNMKDYPFPVEFDEKRKVCRVGTISQAMMILDDVPDGWNFIFTDEPDGKLRELTRIGRLLR